MSAGLTSGEIREALGLPDGERPGRRLAPVVTDSREVEEGALFVALAGARHHGFDFLEEAASGGAAGAVIPADREPPEGLDLEWFPAEDTLAALGDLAAFARDRTDARVVGITGSSGKTTVKEMLTAALSEAFEVHATPGNLNSQVGLPLAILAATGDEDVWVLELGANAPGEIARLTEICAPYDAVVTTVGPSHLEGFGDVEGVLDEKMDLVRGASEEGRVVVGELPSVLPRAARQIRPDAVVAGLGEACDFRPDDWETGADWVIFERRGVHYRVAAGGEHHLRDALLAAATAELLGADPGAVVDGLGDFRPLGMRGALRPVGGLSVVADCYNANPESFEAAIRYCREAFPGRRLAAAVGSMLELGESAPDAHREVARRLVGAGFSTIVATGEFLPAFDALPAEEVAGLELIRAEGAGEAGDALAEVLEGDEVVLVKASRGEGLEAVVHRLEETFGDAAAAGGTAGGSGAEGRRAGPAGFASASPAARSGGGCGHGFRMLEWGA